MGNVKIWTILFLCVAVQGFFLSFLILSRRGNGNKGVDFFLSSFVALFSLIMLFWVGHWNQLFDESSILTFIYRPIPLLLGPLLFFYVKSFFEKAVVKDLLHCIPFILVGAYFLPVYLSSNTVQPIHGLLWKWHLLGSFINTLNTMSILFYSSYLLLFFKSRNKSTGVKIRGGTKKALWSITIFFGGFSLVAFANLLIRLTQSNHPIILDFVMALFISLFIYAIGYLGFNIPALIQVFDKKASALYSSSRLSTEDAHTLLSHLISHLEKHRPYLKEDYKIGQLARETNISSHHISEILNKYHEKSFSDLINEYRIEEAKKLLLSEGYRYKKVSAIGFDVGYSSPSTFHSWFKKITGTSPASFQKKMRS